MNTSGDDQMRLFRVRYLYDFLATALPEFGGPDRLVSVSWVRGGTIQVFDGRHWTTEMIDELTENIVSSLDQDLTAMGWSQSAMARVRIQSASMVREHLLTVSPLDGDELASATPAESTPPRFPDPRSIAPSRDMPRDPGPPSALGRALPSRRFSFDEE